MNTITQTKAPQVYVKHLEMIDSDILIIGEDKLLLSEEAADIMREFLGSCNKWVYNAERRPSKPGWYVCEDACGETKDYWFEYGIWSKAQDEAMVDDNDYEKGFIIKWLEEATV